MKILVTAFEPFGSSPRNSSLETLQSLPDITPFGHVLEKRLLPVVYDRCGQLLESLITETSPGAVVCLGQAEGRGKITPEYIAVNIKNSTSADNAGRICCFEAIEKGGPDGIFTTLPVRKMVEKMQESAVPAAVSFTAGTYVCNNLMYCALRSCTPRGIPAGFIHLPLSAEIAAEENKTCTALSQDMLTDGILCCLDCSE